MKKDNSISAYNLLRLLGVKDPQKFYEDCCYKGNTMSIVFHQFQRAKKSLEKKFAKDVFGDLNDK